MSDLTAGETGSDGQYSARHSSGILELQQIVCEAFFLRSEERFLPLSIENEANSAAVAACYCSSFLFVVVAS